MKQTYLKSFFIATLVVPMLHFANEGNETNHPVGDRAVTAATEEMAEETSESFFKNYPPVYFSPAVHCLAAVSVFGDSLTIEDGSQWVVNARDASKVLSWSSQDPILITQNHRWFSKFKYRIYNQNSGSYVEANLNLGPIDDGKHAPSVIAIDTVHGELVLSDNSRWQISSYDISLFEDWRLNDLIIIGYNSGWDSGSPVLLINVDMNHCVRAQQF